ncbi:MAG: DNA-3-methyladenine glycosylase [Gorillibacterium sp.]|nr:DNA-3-methyladenine glycosylase [Gorillibacterium sp.]
MLDLNFYARDSVTVAEELIGCLLVRRQIDPEKPEIIVMLTETEAYRGAIDPASHAYRGKTARNAIMFGEAGRLYVYFSYGMHSCMNIVTSIPGTAEAVLLRGAVPLKGVDSIRSNRQGIADKDLLNGPGKLTKGLPIGLDMNGYNLLAEHSEWIVLAKERTLPIRRTGRIGISRAQELPWRFVADIPEYRAK